MNTLQRLANGQVAFDKNHSGALALTGSLKCEQLANEKVTPENVDTLAPCFAKIYEQSFLCSKDPNFQYNPNTPEKVSKIANMSFEGQTPDTLAKYVNHINNIQRSLVEQLKDPQLYTQDAHKERIAKAYNQCLGIPVPPVAKQVEKYPGFDCCTYYLPGSLFDKVVKTQKGIDAIPMDDLYLLNHNVLPNLNFDGDNIGSKLGVSKDYFRTIHGRGKTEKENERLFTHVQGTLKFQKQGHYYLRFIADDGVSFRMESHQNGKLVTRDFIPTSAWRSQAPTAYYAHIHIHGNKTEKYARDKGYNYNINWCNGLYAATLKVSYVYTGTQRGISFEELHKKPESIFKLLNSEQTQNPLLTSYRLGPIHNAYAMTFNLRNSINIEERQNGGPQADNIKFGLESMYIYNQNNELMTLQSQKPENKITRRGANLKFNRYKSTNQKSLSSSGAGFADALLSAGTAGKNIELYHRKAWPYTGANFTFDKISIGSIRLVNVYAGNNKVIRVVSGDSSTPLNFLLPLLNNKGVKNHEGKDTYTFTMFPTENSQNNTIHNQFNGGAYGGGEHRLVNNY